MKFDPPLEKGTFLKRYKRFMVDVQLKNGEEITVHCPNTGSMKNCLAPGEPCWFSDSQNPKRKYRHTLEIVTTPDGHQAGVNTARPNALIEEAINDGTIPELQGYESLKREVKYGEENSRIDIFLEKGTEKENQQCFVEVKNVTLCEEGGRGLFPDSVSARGTKHLRELMVMVAEGHRAVLCFCVQHSGIETVSPADEIDELYGKTLREAVDAGVEVIAYRVSMTASEFLVVKSLPIVL
ncbi:MAG: DNA/RNA nuclease SfsA [Cellvibrionaceae bacterium]